MGKEEFTPLPSELIDRARQRCLDINKVLTSLGNLKNNLDTLEFAIKALKDKVFLSDLQGNTLVATELPMRSSSARNAIVLPNDSVAMIAHTIKDVQKMHSDIVVNKLRDCLKEVKKSIMLEYQRLEHLVR